jgi:hypothetical protein
MQKPTSEEGALIKREWWTKWDKDHLPDCYYVIQSYDTAFLKKKQPITVQLRLGECFIPTKMLNQI